MHIGFVTTESPYGDRNSCGIAAYLRAMVPALIDAGHRVTVFANAKEDRTFTSDDGATVYHFRLPSAHWYVSNVPGLQGLATLPLRQLEWSATFKRRIADVVKCEKIDVLEATESGALFLSRLAPLVVRLHGSEFSFRKHAHMPLDLSVRWNDLLEGNAGKRAIAITAPSRFQANEVTNRRGWPSDRVRVIPNPISSTMLEAGLKIEHQRAPDPVVLYTGRLAPVKGIETLLKAAELVQPSNPKVTFVLAGPWQMPQAPDAYGIQLNHKTEGGVQWVGPKDQDELIELYSRASLFVMPSQFESFGISVVEAMAFGLPVVCTNAGALPGLVQDGVTGRVVSPADPRALADAILHSLEDSDERATMVAAARSQVLNKFTVEQTLAASMKVYSGVAGMPDIRLRDLEGAISAVGFNSMRVLLLPASYLPVRGGLQTVTHSLAQSLKLRGHEVSVVTNRYPRELAPSDVVDGVAITRWDFLLPRFEQLANWRLDLFLAGLVYLPSTLTKLFLRLKRERPDVVNLHFAGTAGFFVLLARKLVSFRLVVSLHGDDVEGWGRRSKFDRWLFRALLRRADKVTACSRYLLDLATQIEPEIGAKGMVVYNGIAEHLSNGSEKSNGSVVAAGRFVPKKGFDVLLRAFASGPRRGRLTLIGDGPERQNLEVLARSLGLNGELSFSGEADRERTLDAMRQANVVAIPSLQEPFGMVALEAMALGKPVVASRVGGLPEVLDGADAMLVEAGNSAQLAEAIGAAVERTKSDPTFGQRNRHCAAKFTIDRMTDQYLKTYCR